MIRNEKPFWSYWHAFGADVLACAAIVDKAGTRLMKPDKYSITPILPQIGTGTLCQFRLSRDFSEDTMFARNNG